MKFNQKYCVGRDFLANTFIKILLLFVILLASERQLMATEASVGLSIGYDDNIGHTHEPAGSGFNRYFLILSHSFFLIHILQTGKAISAASIRIISRQKTITRFMPEHP